MMEHTIKLHGSKGVGILYPYIYSLKPMRIEHGTIVQCFLVI